LYTFQDSVNSRLSNMSDIMNEVLCEFRKKNERKTHPSNSEACTIGQEDVGAQEMMDGLVLASTSKPLKDIEKTTQNPSSVKASATLLKDVEL
jgi:hypothetical protein